MITLIAVMSVVFLFLSVLMCVGIVYIIYKLKELKEEGIHVNIIQDHIPSRLEDYDYE